MATTETVGYARRALNHAKTGWVDIKIDHMSRQDAQFWDTYIQPVIRKAAAMPTVAGGAPSREAHLVRFAHDFVGTFQFKDDVDRFQTQVKERIAEFGLDLCHSSD